MSLPSQSMVIKSTSFPERFLHLFDYEPVYTYCNLNISGEVILLSTGVSFTAKYSCIMFF